MFMKQHYRYVYAPRADRTPHWLRRLWLWF